ncbi:hypothetical protein BHM03_00050676 [Ensete ventricosum]|uniref:Uncharacterized protein n=1 Tax=Ensete ventricosum TaxID=4639 RepID=A0A445MLK4_ENSVE|nr:hypothetical protein BHM03_00050676 [Ensete ventricosum]
MIRSLERAMKRSKTMVEVQPVKRKSAQKLSRLRLSLSTLLSGAGELDKVKVNHLFSSSFSVPFSDSCSMTWEKSSARGEFLGNT